MRIMNEIELKDRLLNPYNFILSILVLSFFFHYNDAKAQTGVINIVAGGGASDPGNGGAATESVLRVPTGVFLDSAGNIFIAEFMGHRIRKVDGISGVITTVAGDGSQGFTGDNGLASDAKLSFPSGLFLDNSGNMFIADTNNHRIRKVDSSTGFITTVAGNGLQGFSGDDGLAIEARLSFPSGLFLDNSGNMFIADTNNHRIRKVDNSTGIITTVAGNGLRGFRGDDGDAANAMLNEPHGLSIDSLGNVFVADTNNHRIRKVDSRTGKITTVAGGGLPDDLVGDGGLPGDAKLSFPSGVFVDNANNIFISDTGAHRIRKVDSTTGLIITVAGNGSQGFIGNGGAPNDAAIFEPFGIFVDSANNIFFADQAFVHKVSIEKEPISTPAFSPTPTLIPVTSPTLTPKATLIPGASPSPTLTPKATLTPGASPSPTLTPLPATSPSPILTPTPGPSPASTPNGNGGKSFTFNCGKVLNRGLGGLERLILDMGANEKCILKLTNLIPGIRLEVLTNLRKGFKSSIKIEPKSGVTNNNGELEFTISAIEAGIDWIAWGVKNDKGIVSFDKKAFDAGFAWGMFVEVR